MYLTQMKYAVSEGLKILTAAVGAPDALNACGELVRPGVIQAEIVEAPNRVTSSHARFKNTFFSH
jgi:hypothetical protein